VRLSRCVCWFGSVAAANTVLGRNRRTLWSHQAPVSEVSSGSTAKSIYCRLLPLIVRAYVWSSSYIPHTDLLHLDAYEHKFPHIIIFRPLTTSSADWVNEHPAAAATTLSLRKLVSFRISHRLGGQLLGSQYPDALERRRCWLETFLQAHPHDSGAG
jgi:hypothetical protein